MDSFYEPIDTTPPQLRKTRPSIPKEATLFEFLKGSNFIKNMKDNLTDNEDDINFYASTYNDDDIITDRSTIESIRYGTIVRKIDVVRNYVNNIMEAYNAILQQYVAFHKKYEPNDDGKVYDQFYDPCYFTDHEKYHNDIMMRTKNVIENIKNGKLIMVNIDFTSVDDYDPTMYCEYDNAMLHIYDHDDISVIPHEYIYHFPHEDNVMLLCMLYYKDIDEYCEDSKYKNGIYEPYYHYMTGTLHQDSYYIKFVNGKGDICKGYVKFYYNDNNEQIKTDPKRSRSTAKYIIKYVGSQFTHFTCGDFKSRYPYVKMTIHEISPSDSEFAIIVRFQESGDIIIENPGNIQIISLCDYKPRYKDDGCDMFARQRREAEKCSLKPKEIDILKDITHYYDNDIIPRDKVFISYYNQLRKLMINSYNCTKQCITSITKKLNVQQNSYDQELLEYYTKSINQHKIDIRIITKAIKKVLSKRSDVVIRKTTAIILCNKYLPYNIKLPTEIWEHILYMLGIRITIKFMPLA